MTMSCREWFTPISGIVEFEPDYDAYPRLCKLRSSRGQSCSKRHSNRFLSSRFAVVQSVICSLPEAIRAEVSFRTSSCHAGDSIDASSLDKSAHKASIVWSFSSRDICAICITLVIMGQYNSIACLFNLYKLSGLCAVISRRRLK